jgi:hypothetical protein
LRDGFYRQKLSRALRRNEPRYLADKPRSGVLTSEARKG